MICTPSTYRVPLKKCTNMNQSWPTATHVNSMCKHFVNVNQSGQAACNVWRGCSAQDYGIYRHETTTRLSWNRQHGTVHRTLHSLYTHNLSSYTSIVSSVSDPYIYSSGQKLCPERNHSLYFYQPHIPFLSTLSWHCIGLRHKFWPQLYVYVLAWIERKSTWSNRNITAIVMFL